jgi:hypothetical protein
MHRHRVRTGLGCPRVDWLHKLSLGGSQILGNHSHHLEQHGFKFHPLNRIGGHIGLNGTPMFTLEKVTYGQWLIKSHSLFMEAK